MLQEFLLKLTKSRPCNTFSTSAARTVKIQLVISLIWFRALTNHTICSVNPPQELFSAGLTLQLSLWIVLKIVERICVCVNYCQNAVYWVSVVNFEYVGYIIITFWILPINKVIITIWNCLIKICQRTVISAVILSAVQ